MGRNNRKGRIALLLALLLLLCPVLTGCGGEGPEEWAEETPDQSAGYRRTVLYYESDDGQLVPVMKLLPWEEGIGKAALNQLVDTETNRMSASSMGLKNVVPQGVSFVLSISDDAVATLNICDLPEFESAEAESAMVTAVVNTLTHFPTINAVQLQFDGKVLDTLPQGTAVSAPMGAVALNEEPLPVNASEEDLSRVTLYFPNRAASLNVPVTRYIPGEAGFEAAMAELVKGPVDDTLRNCFPEGTAVRSAMIEDGTAKVDFSEEFAALNETPDLEEAAMTSMQLTAQQFGAVSALHVTVEGKEYEPAGESTMAMPMYVNEFRS